MTRAPAPTYRTYPSKEAAAEDMARATVDVLRAGIADRGSDAIALTGGSSPGPLYRALAEHHRGSLDWRAVDFFLGDERDVPHDHADSNMRTCAPILETVGADPARLHPWRTDQRPEDALEAMRQVLAKAGLTHRGLDLCLLGVGEDGHVASLFPEHEPWRLLGRTDRADDVAYVADSPKPPAGRYTFTLPFINRSRYVFLMPFGEDKRDAVAGFRQNDDALPVRYVRGVEGTVVWTDLEVGKLGE